MDPELKKKWIEALRSGEYEQGRHYLRRTNENGDRFCCLGVLCDIVDPTRWCDDDEDIFRCYQFPETALSSILSQSFREKMGLSRDQHQILWRMNDSQDQTFEQIADYIEENL